MGKLKKALGIRAVRLGIMAAFVATFFGAPSLGYVIENDTLQKLDPGKIVTSVMLAQSDGTTGTVDGTAGPTDGTTSNDGTTDTSGTTGTADNSNDPMTMDTDGDGLVDALDPCPNEAEPNGGCPDTDGDGTPDFYDQCPSEVGTDPTGCPETDSDGDGVPDSVDSCPGVYGDKTDGCSSVVDSDGDGIQDQYDACPTEYGMGSDGCYDSDGDGISDQWDSCPNEWAQTSDGCSQDYNDDDHDGGDDSMFENCPDEEDHDQYGCLDGYDDDESTDNTGSTDTSGTSTVPNLELTDIYTENNVLTVVVTNTGDVPLASGDTGHTWIEITSDDTGEVDTWNYSWDYLADTNFYNVGGKSYIQPQVLYGKNTVKACVNYYSSFTETTHDDNCKEVTVTGIIEDNDDGTYEEYCDIVYHGTGYCEYCYDTAGNQTYEYCEEDEYNCASDEWMDATGTCQSYDDNDYDDNDYDDNDNYDDYGNWVGNDCESDEWIDMNGECHGYDECSTWEDGVEIFYDCDDGYMSDDEQERQQGEAYEWIEDKEGEVERRYSEMKRWIRSFARDADRKVQEVERELDRGWMSEEEAENRLEAAEELLELSDYYTDEIENIRTDVYSFSEYLKGVAEDDVQNFWEASSAWDKFWLLNDALGLLIEVDQRGGGGIEDWQNEAERLIEDYEEMGYEDLVPDDLYEMQDLAEDTLSALTSIRSDAKGIYDTLDGTTYESITSWDAMSDLRDQYEWELWDLRDEVQWVFDDWEWSDPWWVMDFARQQMGTLEHSFHLQKEIDFIRVEVEEEYAKVDELADDLKATVEGLLDTALDVLDKMEEHLQAGEPWKAERGFGILDQIKHHFDRVMMGHGTIGQGLLDTKEATINSFQSTLGMDNDPKMALMAQILGEIPEDILEQAVNTVVQGGLSDKFGSLMEFDDFELDDFIKGVPHFGDHAEDVLTAKGTLLSNVETLKDRISVYEQQGVHLRNDLKTKIEDFQEVASTYVFVGDQATEMETILEEVNDAVVSYAEGDLSLSELTSELSEHEDDVDGLVESNTEELQENGVVSYPDVNPMDWFFTFTEGATDQGIVGGYEDGTYGPGNTLMVSEIVKMTQEAAFDDIASASGEWYQKYVNNAENHGINLSASESVAYADMGRPAKRSEVIHLSIESVAKASGMDAQEFLGSILGTTDPYSLSASYWDVPQSHSEFLYIEAATALGIVSGNPDGSFSPDNDVNRAEASKMIVNVSEVGQEYQGSVTLDELDDEYINAYFEEASMEDFYGDFADDLDDMYGSAETEGIILPGMMVPEGEVGEEIILPGMIMDTDETESFFQKLATNVLDLFR